MLRQDTHTENNPSFGWESKIPIECLVAAVASCTTQRKRNKPSSLAVRKSEQARSVALATEHPSKGADTNLVPSAWAFLQIISIIPLASGLLRNRSEFCERMYAAGGFTPPITAQGRLLPASFSVRYFVPGARGALLRNRSEFCERMYAAGGFTPPITAQGRLLPASFSVRYFVPGARGALI